MPRTFILRVTLYLQIILYGKNVYADSMANIPVIRLLEQGGYIVKY
jgi:hypothetical protein